MNPYQPPAAAYGQPYPGAQALDPRASGEVSELAIELLRQTRPWVLFLSILAFLGSGFMLIAGVAFAGIGLASGSGGLQGAVGLMYLPIGLIYVYPAIKMWAYGSAISRLGISRATVDLESALAQQKSLWKFLGIAVIVMIALYIVMFGVIAVMAVRGKFP